MAKTRAAHGSSARKNEALMNPEETEQIHPQTETAPTEAANQQALDVVTATSPLAKPETDPDEEVQIALQNLEKRRAEKKRKKRQQLIGIGAAALALVAGIAGWRLLSAGSAEEEVAPEYATVERGNYEDDITGSGTLKAGSTVAVTPEVDGIIESVLVTEGQQVNEGDLLFTLKNDSLDKAVRDAAQDVQTAQQGVDSAQRSVEFAAASRDDAWNRYYSAWNEADDAARAMLAERGKDTFELTAEETARWRERIYPVLDKFAAKADAKGLPGHAFLNDLLAEVAKNGK